MDGTAILVSYIVVGEDKIGQAKKEQVRNEIFVSQRSVDRNEFYNAGRNGLNPSLVLITSEYNYNGETEVIYNGQMYTIYRTYHAETSDEIELYIERRSGNVGQDIN